MILSEIRIPLTVHLAYHTRIACSNVSEGGYTVCLPLSRFSYGQVDLTRTHWPTFGPAFHTMGREGDSRGFTSKVKLGNASTFRSSQGSNRLFGGGS